MKESKEVLVNGELVYLKKDILGWHVTHPVKIDGKINYKNLIAGGSWLKLIFIIIFVILALRAIFEVSSIVKVANECILSNQSIPINPVFLGNISIP